VSGLAIADLELVWHLADAARELARRLERLRPAILLAPAYEGGHPDHDAAAVAAAAACALVAQGGAAPPARFEMALYHGAPGRMTTYAFVDRAGPEIESPLDPAARARKLAMLRCHASQAAVLAPFLAAAAERYRPAPDPDFARPPHSGPLLYETWSMPPGGDRWRELAAAAWHQLGLPAPVRQAACVPAAPDRAPPR
jgi:LmbE family N-acetylglucosaminyl deacetylase